MVRKAKQGLEGHWARILDDFAESDCDVRQYCQNLKISRASLYKWSQWLGIPLCKQRSASKATVIDQEDMHQTTSIGNDSPFSFIELKIPPSNTSISFPLKLELLLAQERKLKIEVPSTWEQMVGMIKALVS